MLHVEHRGAGDKPCRHIQISDTNSLSATGLAKVCDPALASLPIAIFERLRPIGESKEPQLFYQRGPAYRQETVLDDRLQTLFLTLDIVPVHLIASDQVDTIFISSLTLCKIRLLED